MDKKRPQRKLTTKGVKYLTPEEELFYIKMAKQGNRPAFDKLFESYRFFILAVVGKYKGIASSMTMDDLFQESIFGLRSAIDMYDLNCGHKFLSYAVWWIRSAVLNAIQKDDRFIRLPRNYEVDIAKYKYKKKEMPKDLQNLMMLTGCETSLDAPLVADESYTLADVMADPREFLDDLQEKDILNLINIEVNKLENYRARYTVIHILGLQGNAPTSFRACALVLGVSFESLRQHYNRSLERIRINLNRKINKGT